MPRPNRQRRLDGPRHARGPRPPDWRFAARRGARFGVFAFAAVLVAGLVQNFDALSGPRVWLVLRGAFFAGVVAALATALWLALRRRTASRR